MSRFKHGDLPQRSKHFALRVLDFVDLLPNNTKGWIISKQLVRAGTGIGANLREADGALTDREFAQLANIARRQGEESGYWLELCHESPGMLTVPDSASALISEADELHKILASIVRKTQENLK